MLSTEVGGISMLSIKQEETAVQEKSVGQGHIANYQWNETSNLCIQTFRIHAFNDYAINHFDIFLHSWFFYSPEWAISMDLSLNLVILSFTN